MDNLPNIKKWLKRIVIISTLLITTVVGGFYLLMKYRLKSSIQYIVKETSKGKYAFDAESASLSLFRKTISLKNATIRGLDTTHVDVHGEIKVKEIFFSVSSFRHMILDERIVVDSLAIIEPDIKVHVHKLRTRKRRTADIDPTNFKDVLQGILAKFNARSFALKDASFTYQVLNAPEPFYADHVNVSVSNFTQVTESDDHILGSDNVDFSLGRQHWVFPGGTEINFKGIFFNSKGQHFELDSFFLHRKPTADKGEMLIQADKFFFNSRHLPAIYMRNELLIDSLICINPVVTLPAIEKDRKRRLDTAVYVRDYIFDLINIGYVGVIDGEVKLKSKSRLADNATSEKTNLSIFNLKLDPQEKQAISIDSVSLALDSIAFLSKDSLFQLNIDAFSFMRNNVLFRNVRFGPSPYKDNDRGIRFNAPSLLVKNISIEDLLRRRITATEAELIKPEISFVLRGRKTVDGSTNNRKRRKGLNSFYKSLHDLSELINVPVFKIVDGAASISGSGDRQINGYIDNLDARIALNRFFHSDSLVEIKHAIPDLRISRAGITTPKTTIEVQNYHFDGINRQNHSDELLISLANGTVLKGSNITWQLFDWDVFEKTRNIQLEQLLIGQLHILVGNRIHNEHSDKDLPVIRVDRLRIDNMKFDGGEENDISFNAQGLFANQIRSVNRHFTWNELKGNIYNFHFGNEGINLSVDTINLDNQATTTIKSLNFKSDKAEGYSYLKIPLIKLGYNITSTDFTNISPSFIQIESPEVNILAHTRNAEGGAGVKMPLSVDAALLAIYNGKLDYKQVKDDGDTLAVNTVFNINASGLKVRKSGADMLQYKFAGINANDVWLSNKNVFLQVPYANIVLNDGVLNNSFHTAIELDWKQATLNYTKDSTQLSINNISGSFNEPSFSFYSGKKFTWRDMIAKTAIDEGGLSYRNDKVTVNVDSYSWHPDVHKATLSGFSFTPILSMEETFKKAQWQGDYIYGKGKMLVISGLSMDTKADSLLHAESITVDSADINVSRDKSIAFKHGVEKWMPGRLMQHIPFPIQLDTTVVNNMNVVYNEFSVGTQKWAAVPINNINGYLLNITNRPEQTDSLKIVASAQLLNSNIQQFVYAESYTDSLSSFTAQSHFSPMALTSFTELSMPLAAVSINKGNADTLYSFWQGNKYASYGTMNFLYDHLRIGLYNKETMQHNRFKSFAANLFLSSRNKKPSIIFFERDTEKFIFNYWVKTHLSGFQSAIGIKKNKNYRKQYLQKQAQYMLPYRAN